MTLVTCSMGKGINSLPGYLQKDTEQFVFAVFWDKCSFDEDKET